MRFLFFIVVGGGGVVDFAARKSEVGVEDVPVVAFGPVGVGVGGGGREAEVGDVVEEGTDFQNRTLISPIQYLSPNSI